MVAVMGVLMLVVVLLVVVYSNIPIAKAFDNLPNSTCRKSSKLFACYLTIFEPLA